MLKKRNPKREEQRAETYPSARAALFILVISMTGSSLQDRVRALCFQVTAAQTDAELRALLPQLQSAIHDHIDYLRAVAIEVIPEAFGRPHDTQN